MFSVAFDADDVFVMGSSCVPPLFLYMQVRIPPCSLLQVFNMAGEQLNMVRYHSSFLGQHIGPVSCLNFHPYSMLLAAGHTDSIVSVYSGEVARSW